VKKWKQNVGVPGKLFILALGDTIEIEKLMKRPEIVQRIAEVIKRVAPDAKTILYGSEARGDARPDSDIDLLVLLEGEKRDYKREDEIYTPLYDLELETGVSISPMFVLRKDWENRPFRTPFYINVINEGIVL